MTHRTPWSAIPPEVVAAIEAELGASVVETRSAADGFTPAVAVAANLADGRTVFLKACTAEINADTIKAQRHEAMVVRQLPSTVPTPALLFEADVADWHVLAFEHVGAQPVTDPIGFMRGIDAFYDSLADVSIDGLTHLVADTSISTSWAQLADDVPNLDALVEMEARVLDFADDDHLLHCDLRFDNALVGADGRDIVVDWAAACRGPAHFDAIATIPSLVTRFGATVPDLVGASRLIAECDSADLTAIVAGVAGYFARASTRPAPANMPTLRAYQRAQAVPMLAWLNALVGDRIAVPAMDDIERALQPGRSL